MKINIDANIMLEEIATKLGVTVEKLYPILYKQLIIDVIFNFLSVVLIVIGIYLYVKFVKFSVERVYQEIRISKEKDRHLEKDWFDYPEYIIPMAVGGVLSFVGVIVAVYLLKDAFTGLMNPDYCIIESMLNRFVE